MPRRSFGQRSIRSLTKVSSGKSYGITIPIEYIKDLKWEAHQKLRVVMEGDKIVIRDLAQ